ncbi:hypothetical protein GL4_2257 [Methyloceanibacter caenitepidi]|uniref:Uncharacterized protein n=1 Tax=Methyloceanibacter caenitepidi TaxID=1384459 RepID=A0A0A8K6S4_9HYPH|nr:hypothetical protein GL4_2257 [Methyloceanibacter caenitepidi]
MRFPLVRERPCRTGLPDEAPCDGGDGAKLFGLVVGIWGLMGAR